MSLDLYIIGREVLPRRTLAEVAAIFEVNDKNSDDDFPIDIGERILSVWGGWGHEPLVDWFAENLRSSGHAGYDDPGNYYFLDEDDLRAVIAAVKEKGLGMVMREELGIAVETDTTDYTAEYVAQFEKALKWLEGPTQRKIYFEVNC